MGLMKRFFANMSKPKGLLGKMALTGMNHGHSAMAKWCFTDRRLPRTGAVLDIGCGGGANLKRWDSRMLSGVVIGADHSEVCVQKSRRINAQAIHDGRCRVVQAEVNKLPFADGTFDFVSAFETIYFWPEIDAAFREVARVLKPGGTFFVANEADGSNPKDERWVKLIDGMTLYTPEEIGHLMRDAGFEKLCIRRHPEKQWFAITGRLPEEVKDGEDETER